MASPLPASSSTITATTPPARRSWIESIAPTPPNRSPMASPQPESRPLYELIYDVLREHLVEASLPPGLVFGETTVARAFGSSRIPAAAALQRLKSEGLLKSFDGRGLIAAAADPDELVRSELVEAGLRLPTAVASGRNHHGRIYPLVEHTIAASLSYGKFLVNESALAEHYGVS